MIRKWPVILALVFLGLTDFCLAADKKILPVTPRMRVSPSLLHYGDTLTVEVSAPGAEKVILTANIEDPPFIPMPYDAQKKMFVVDYPIPDQGMDVEEGAYIFKATVYYPDGHKVKLRKRVWFEDDRKVRDAVPVPLTRAAENGNKSPKAAK